VNNVTLIKSFELCDVISVTMLSSQPEFWDAAYCDW